MINNEKELTVTRHWRNQFQEALTGLNVQIEIGLMQTTPLINRLHREALENIIVELDIEIESYMAHIRLDNSTKAYVSGRDDLVLLDHSKNSQ